MKFLNRFTIGACAVMGIFSSFGSAAVITQWGFNLNQLMVTGTGTYNNANAGSGVGSTSTVPSGLALLLPANYPAAAFGSSADTSVVSTGNGYATMNSANATDASGQGVQLHVSTAGQTGIAYQTDFKPGSRASKYWQVMYTSDGSTWQPVPSGGTGSIASVGVYTGTTVSSSGLVTINAPTNLTSTAALNSQSDWIQGLSYQFPTGGAWENNANFGVGLYQIYNPNQSNVSALDYGYVSAGWGLNNNVANGTTGYIRGSASGGTQRFDLITVSALPEPTMLGAMGLLGLATLSRRRR